MMIQFPNLIIGLCIIAIFVSIWINFSRAKDMKVKREKKSIVETGSMTLFFVCFYLILKLGIGTIRIDKTVQFILIIIGLAGVVFGCIVNISGRISLGKNWANQVIVYKSQTLVRKGFFRYVRHPLYASLFLMFYGASLVYSNYIAFLANTFIFIPFMYYRARQEEELLSKELKGYDIYKKEVGMFFPKILR